MDRKFYGNRGISTNFHAIPYELQELHGAYTKTSKADLMDAFADIYFELVDDNGSWEMLFAELKRRVDICKRYRKERDAKAEGRE